MNGRIVVITTQGWEERMGTLKVACADVARLCTREAG